MKQVFVISYFYKAKSFHKRDHNIDGVEVWVAHTMKYDFFLQTKDKKQATSAFVLTFNCQNHDKPTLEDFDNVMKLMDEAIRNMTVLKHSLHGPSEKNLDIL